MDHDVLYFLQFVPMGLHHPVVRFLYQGHVHPPAQGMAQDLTGKGVPEDAEVYGLLLIAPPVVEVSDVGQDDLPGADIELLHDPVLGSSTWMVVHCLVLIGVLPGPGGRQMHHLHDGTAPLCTDVPSIIIEQMQAEGPFARDITELSDDGQEKVHQSAQLLQLTCPFTVPVLLPCLPGIVSGL